MRRRRRTPRKAGSSEASPPKEANTTTTNDHDDDEKKEKSASIGGSSRSSVSSDSANNEKVMVMTTTRTRMKKASLYDFDDAFGKDEEDMDEEEEGNTTTTTNTKKNNKKKVSFCDDSTVLVYDDEVGEVNNNARGEENTRTPRYNTTTFLVEKLMDKPSKIRLETSNELKHQRAKLKEKLLRMEEQYDAAKRCMEEGEYRACASMLENVVIRELAERINARQFQMNLEKLRFQRHRRLAILEEQTRVGGKLKRKLAGAGGRSHTYHGQQDLDAETRIMTTTTTTTTTTTSVHTATREDDSVSAKKKDSVNEEKIPRRRSGESLVGNEASTLQTQLGLNANNRSRENKEEQPRETHKTVDISPRSSPSTSTDSFVDINRVVQSDVQQASSEFTTSQEKRMNFEVSPAPPARELKTPQELTMIASALDMCAKAYENMGNKWAAEQKLKEATRIREIIARCDPTTDTVAAVASPLQNFCPIEPTSMNSTLVHQTKLFETRMKQLFSSSVSSAAAVAAASEAASEMQS